MKPPLGPSIEIEDREPFCKKVPTPRRNAVSRYGMVSTQHFSATEAAVEILEAGGNAMDAAVAAAFALGVCEPAASGLGGQTAILTYDSSTKKTVALDGSSKAPFRVMPGKYSKEELLRGYKAATVPSTPAVLEYSLNTYGTLKLKDVLAPSIRLANNGVQVTELQYALTKRTLKHLRKRSAAQFFLQDGKKPYLPGSTMKQPLLAETLKRLGKHGVKTFYRGKIAKAIHEDMKKNGGLIRKDDLAQIPWPIERKPLSSRYDSWRIFTFPPPGAGRTLIELMNIIGNMPEECQNPDTPFGAAALANIIRKGNIDRSDRPFDPNFFPQVKEKKMMSQNYSEEVANNIFRMIQTSGDTTHLSVMDKYNNAVSLTQSIERVYGSCEASPELGFLYNNYMSAFEHEDINHPYFLRPAAVPWASVAPTIIFSGNKPRLVIGSPGSERIAPTIMQVLLRLKKQSPLEAVSAPRLHCSLEGKVSLEISRIRDDIPQSLEKNGFSIDEREAFSFYLGCVQLVMRENGNYIGVADPRRDGSAKGPRW